MQVCHGVSSTLSDVNINTLLHFLAGGDDTAAGASKLEGSTLGNNFARVEKAVRATSELNLRTRQQCLEYLGSQ